MTDLKLIACFVQFVNISELELAFFTFRKDILLRLALSGISFSYSYLSRNSERVMCTDAADHAGCFLS